MRFIAQPMVPGTSSIPVDGRWVAWVARAAEAAGFDALAFEDHPAPPRAWMEGGGHQALEPFAAICFAAAVTERIRLLPLLAVAPYRNPLLLAKAIATADVLSGGRLIVCAGVGYLEAEFAALGQEFAARNDRFDEALDVLRTVWTGDAFTYRGDGFVADDIVSRPVPVQRPHPPLWIGGNSARSRGRAARLGDGWAPLQAHRATTRMARTAAIVDDDSLRAGIEDLRRRADAAGRDPAAIDVAVTALTLVAPDGRPRWDPEGERRRVADLAALGATWCVVLVAIDGGGGDVEELARYGAEVIDARATGVTVQGLSPPSSFSVR